MKSRHRFSSDSFFDKKREKHEEFQLHIFIPRKLYCCSEGQPIPALRSDRNMSNKSSFWEY